MSFGEELKTAAIVGTAQKELNLPHFDGKLGEVLTKIDRADRERFLLSNAAVFSIWQAAGKSLTTDKQNAPEIAENETREILSGRLKQIFEMFLDSSNIPLLTEFLDLMEKGKKLVPPELLPQTIEFFSKNPTLRQNVLSLTGNRGKWLARHNQDWKWVLVEESGKEIFETGKTNERVFALEYLRKKDAEKGRELLQSVWQSEAAAERQKFLDVLRLNLTNSDEQFLTEIFLTDKSAEVKRTAFDLLARLRNSEFSDKFSENSRNLLEFFDNNGRTQIRINFPPSWQKQTEDCGVPEYSRSITDLGRKGWLLIQHLGATPLSVWEDKFISAAAEFFGVSVAEISGRFPLKPYEVVQAVLGNEWAAELQLGFMIAAERQRNSDWSQALMWGFSFPEHVKSFDGKNRSRDVFDEKSVKMISLYTDETLEKFIDEIWLKKDEPLHDDHGLMYFLENIERPWSEKISRFFIGQFKKQFHIKNARDKKKSVWRTLEFFPKAAFFVPIYPADEVLFEITDYQPEALRAIEEFQSNLNILAEMTKLFTTEN